MTAAEKEYNSPLLQRNMDIIGKVILTATHVNIQDCDGPDDYKQCYPILDLTEDQFYTENLLPDTEEIEIMTEETLTEFELDINGEKIPDGFEEDGTT